MSSFCCGQWASSKYLLGVYLSLFFKICVLEISKCHLFTISHILMLCLKQTSLLHASYSLTMQLSFATVLLSNTTQLHLLWTFLVHILTWHFEPLNPFLCVWQSYSVAQIGDHCPTTRGRAAEKSDRQIYSGMKVTCFQLHRSFYLFMCFYIHFLSLNCDINRRV